MSVLYWAAPRSFDCKLVSSWIGLVRKTHFIVIKSRLLRSAADEHYAPQGLPRLRIRNCGSAQRGRQAHLSRNQSCADGCQNYYGAQLKIILTVLHGGVPSGVNFYGVARKMRAKGLALEIMEASLLLNVFCLHASLVTSDNGVMPNS